MTFLLILVTGISGTHHDLHTSNRSPALLNISSFSLQHMRNNLQKSLYFHKLILLRLFFEKTIRISQNVLTKCVSVCACFFSKWASKHNNYFPHDIVICNYGYHLEFNGFQKWKLLKRLETRGWTARGVDDARGMCVCVCVCMYCAVQMSHQRRAPASGDHLCVIVSAIGWRPNQMYLPQRATTSCVSQKTAAHSRFTPCCLQSVNTWGSFTLQHLNWCTRRNLCRLKIAAARFVELCVFSCFRALALVNGKDSIIFTVKLFPERSLSDRLKILTVRGKKCPGILFD